jgi:cysteine synthase
MLAQEDVDEVIAVPEAQAFAMARRAAQEEGLISGPSTGANIAAALALARRLGSARRVVTIQVDSGLKYLAGDLYAA